MAFVEVDGCLYDDPRMTEEDKLQIDILPDAESMEYWDRYVSPTNRHFMLLDSKEWPATLVHNSDLFFNWLNDWNANYAEPFTRAMQALEFSSDDTVILFWMRELGVRTKWNVFTRNWINFLYEDEGCILLSENRMNAMVFSYGYSWAGIRGNLPDESDNPSV